MTDLSFSVPPELAVLMQSGIAGGSFAGVADYVQALIRRDLDEAADTAWVRAMVAEGLASGVIEQDASEVIKEIIAGLSREDG